MQKSLIIRLSGAALLVGGLAACDPNYQTGLAPDVTRAGGGALADLGSHALATAEFLLGPITRVLGDCVTAISERPDGKGGHRAIEVDDIGRAFLRFENGASGSIEGNWIATGRKMQHDFEIHGSKGALCFSQERFNELHFYSNDAFLPLQVE